MDETLEDDVEETRLSEVEEAATTSSAGLSDRSFAGSLGETHLGMEGRSNL